MNARLSKALRIILDARLTPNSDGSFTVLGSTGKQYRVSETCSCPQGSQYGRTKYCQHLVAVRVYIEWQRRLRHTPPPLGTQVLASDPDDDDALESGYPVDDQTLPLPLPPTTIDERLAHPPVTAQEARGDVMPADEYIPEPATTEAATAVLDAPKPVRALTPVTSPTSDLEQALTTWTAERAIVQRFLKQELRPNVDYYTLKIGGRDSKPSLSKAGAEKVMGWLKLQASFAPDTGTWEMLGKPQDVVTYVCTLRTRSGEIVGEGRGARSIKKDGGDINKAIKMAEKSACVSAVLRTGALSDVFTCDLEDMQDAPEPTPARPTSKSQDLRQRIWAIVQARQPSLTGRDEVAAWVQAETELTLHPDNYQAIVDKLGGGR
jgi:hypothetical protein